MHNLFCANIFVFIISLLLSILSQSSGQACTTGSYKNDPNDCNYYYQCNHGSWERRQCGSGLHWNSKNNNCDWPANAGCTTGGTTTRSPSTTSTMRPSSSGTSTARPTQGPGPSGRKIICYFTNWAFYRPGSGKYTPDNIDSSLCTHIIYSFALLDSNELTIKISDTWADIDNKFFEKVTNLKSRGIKVTIAIGGWNESEGDKYSRMVNNPQSRSKFVRSVVDFVAKYNFDGIDLDWEYPRCWQGDCNRGPESDRVNFSNLVKELKEALPRGSIVSAAVSAGKNIIDQGYDVPTLSRYLDWIGVMSYDFRGSWDGKTGHHSPLTSNDNLNTDFAIKYWASKGADRSKLILGIPTYGQSFTLRSANQNGLDAPTTGGGRAGEFTRQSGFLSYYEICRQGGWNVRKSSRGDMGPYAFNNDQWVCYDDPEMVVRKTNYIKNENLGGAMIWALDLDDFNGSCGRKYPLLSEIKNNIN